ncbi:MAG: 50S ribosomal protein L6 [Anaerobiospirillum succiniciproducens]|uniref:50S ribosomal protein L6 n=1 Tax=Anaerobiospirillum succiniciproducens TaxID=13335 RepID=UPI000416327E|nr:50S ribosomal protein L6 [Anaerobiospirillum succiniciproducens]MDO4676210.1 50S ribosomal protein L6 [Anaerobiospirillum succiniciproducens]MDY2798452.1 50S ribosomal protein L6 [Anaerobiospirillum succiniciproducens]
MSRIAKEPVLVPQGVEVSIDGQLITVKSKKGQLQLNIHPLVKVEFVDNALKVNVADDSAEANMQSGTTRALLQNMVVGLDKGYEKKLNLVGVGFRAQAKGKVLNLALGFSHPIDHELPEGITCETPSQTEIVLKGFDKALLGQVAADIRAYRQPEPYKGKGIRYSDEVVRIKEAKKK